MHITHTTFFLPIEYVKIHKTTLFSYFRVKFMECTHVIFIFHLSAIQMYINLYYVYYGYVYNMYRFCIIIICRTVYTIPFNCPPPYMYVQSKQMTGNGTYSVFINLKKSVDCLPCKKILNIFYILCVWDIL